MQDDIFYEIFLRSASCTEHNYIKSLRYVVQEEADIITFLFYFIRCAF